MTWRVICACPSDEAPDPAAPLANAAKSAAYVAETGSQSSDLRHELDAALAALAAAEETAKSNSGAASEVRTLKDSMKERVEFAVKDRLFAADKRVAELEVAADAAAEAQGRADAALSEMRRLHEGRAVATLRA